MYIIAQNEGIRQGDAAPLDPLPKGPVPLETLLALTRGKGQIFGESYSTFGRKSGSERAGFTALGEERQYPPPTQ